MVVTKQQALATARRVLRGALARDQLATVSRREQAYIAVAIMLALPQYYLDGMRVRDWGFEKTLEELLSIGVLDQPGMRKVYGGAHIGACRSAGLYRSEVRIGQQPRLFLTPPSELVELVQEFGASPGVLAFHAHATACVAWQEQQNQELRRAEGERRGQIAARAEQVIARLREELDPEVFAEVRDRLHY